MKRSKHAIHSLVDWLVILNLMDWVPGLLASAEDLIAFPELNPVVAVEGVVGSVYQEDSIGLNTLPMETLHLDQGVQSRPVDTRDTSIDPGGPPEPIKDYPTTPTEVRQDTLLDSIQMCGDV